MSALYQYRNASSGLKIVQKRLFTAPNIWKYSLSSNIRSTLFRYTYAGLSTLTSARHRPVHKDYYPTEMHATRVLRLGGISLLPLAMSGPTPVRLLRTTTRRRSSQPPPQQPQPKNPNLMPSAVPLLHRPGSFTILTLLRYTTSMLPILFAISVPGINDEYGYALTSLFAASSLIPAGFIRWYSAPYVYVAQLELPQNLRGREAVKAWVKHGDIRDANLRLRRIGGRWEQVRIGDLQRKEERAKCVDTIEKVGKVRRFYFGEGPGKVREGWMLGEILRRIGEISGKGN